LKTTSCPQNPKTTGTLRGRRHESTALAATTALAPAALDAPRPSSKARPRPQRTHCHGERSNLQLYLQEIGKTALLTIAEEITLARRIRRGDKAARDHMISANLRLVVKIAMDYKDFGLRCSISSARATSA